MSKPRSLLLALWALGAGCTAGRDYEPPKTPVSDSFEQAGTASGTTEDPVVVQWWKQFEDPILDRLIDRAIAGNRDVRTATALLRETRALYDLEKFDLVPTLTAAGGYTRELESSAVLPGIPRNARTFGFWNAGFDASWEFDLFGRIQRLTEAAAAEVGASEASRRDVLVTLLAEVARNYFEYRGLRYQLDVARRNLVNQEESLKFVTSRFDAGRGTELDVSRARAELQSTRALIPPIETDALRAKNRVAVLLGEAPTRFVLETPPPAPLGKLPPLIAIGRPEELLRRRPDIRQAERSLAAATARIGVATADLFPRLSFSGTFGPQSQTVPGLFHAGSAAYAFGPTLTWAALDLGRVESRIRAADAHADAELSRYEQTVLLALEDTENALFTVGRTRERRDALVEAVASSERAAALADARYQGGAVDYLALLDAQRTVLSFQLQLSESQTSTVTAFIALYKALGGGWQYAPEPRAQGQ
ncbi:MAG TPA: efflux transporter outer membrane subunit [Planctomycetota bacterium]|nr:efflux transporter outer membrane subunit [Planctomycetota bacterium]